MTSEQELAQWRSLSRWLYQHAPYLGEPLALKKFDAGQSNPSFLLECEHQSLVLRRKPAGQLLASAHAVDREFRLISALQHSEVPVPRPVLLCEDPDVIGSIFYLMSYEPGDIFWDPALPECDTGQRAAYYFALTGTLARLHTTDYRALGLTDFGKPGNYYARQLARWRSQYQASATRVIPEMDALIDWLSAHLPDDDQRSCIIHGDYRLDNVIFYQGTRYHGTSYDGAPYQGAPEIRAVLDWELATLGHPMADLAYYLMALRLPRHGEIRGLKDENLPALGIPGEEQLIQHYCDVAGTDYPENWPFYLAFSFFRLAAILQGVYKRGLDGNASSERATRMGKLVQPLAAEGLATVTSNLSGR